MQKKNIFRIIIGATIFLIIPFLGNIFIDGWDWSFGDFVFAWVFLNIFGLTYIFVRNKILNSWLRIITEILVIIIFFSIWVVLATG